MMNKNTEQTNIVVLYGGVSSEREVSLVSGRCIYEALKNRFPTQLIDITERALPPGIDPKTTIVFPALHGAFGEDGELQALLEVKGIHYVGSDAATSALCMNKPKMKEKVQGSGWNMPQSLHFLAEKKPTLEEILRLFGSFSLVLKPTHGGSTIGVSIISNEEQLIQALAAIHSGSWMLEERIMGRECTIAILNGVAMGIIEIIPQSGFYDYQRKYTPGTTEYMFPAKITSVTEAKIKRFTENAYKACACRDYARLDFILTPDDRPYFLEINTIPGFTPTSLLPKSVSCQGYNFESLLDVLIALAFKRFQTTQTIMTYV